MTPRLAYILYRAFLPVVFLIAFPGWLLKTIRRGGWSVVLLEKIGIYTDEPEFEPCGAIHLHAVSVGETALALKWIRASLAEAPDRRFVLATGTATGHQLATSADIDQVRVTYAPLDFPWMIRSYFRRFEPRAIVLIEAEVWPNLLKAAHPANIPVILANARTSPRTSRRLTKFASVLRPFYSGLDAVCIQEESHRELWQTLGVRADQIHHTGSLKFDPESSAVPAPLPAFAERLAAFGSSRPVVLAASTFPGEEEWIAQAISNADPLALPVLVPRHAERRAEVTHALSQAGFSVHLRSLDSPITEDRPQAFVIDSTGELSTWINHADVVIIGKSFLARGGQNPAEAILAGKPLVLGPFMDNFQPLAQDLVAHRGALLATDQPSLAQAIREALRPEIAAELTQNATRVLSAHQGATRRHLSVLQAVLTSA